MSNRPIPTFNGQCPINCIAVLEKKDLIATINYANELEVRRISDQQILYQKLCFYANKMHFWGEYLLMYDHYSFTLLDWQNDIVIKNKPGFVFSNLKYYLSYQEGFFQLRSLFDDTVYWENKQDNPDSFTAKIGSEFLFIKTQKNNSSEFQLWNFNQNKRIEFENHIKNDINLELDFEQLKYDDALKYIAFLNDGKNLLIEQYKDDCWRILILSLESFRVVANEVLDHKIYFGLEDFTQLYCYKDSFYYLHENQEVRNYSLLQKSHDTTKIKFENSSYFSNFFLDEFNGIMYFLGMQNEILTLDLESGSQFLINFELPYRIDESTLFSGFTMYASSFSGGLIKVDLKTNERLHICYASDEVQDSQILKDKIFNISRNHFVTIWDLSTNKILKRMNLNKESSKGSILNELMPFDKNFCIDQKKSLVNSFKNFDFYGSLNCFFDFEKYQKVCFGNEAVNLTLDKKSESISYCSSTTHWTKKAPEFFESLGTVIIFQKIHNNCIYISNNALYKVNLLNGELNRLITFKKHDFASCVQIEGDYIFIGMESFCIYIFDLKKLELLHKISTGHECSHSLLFCHKRQILFVASSYCSEITVYDVLSGKEVHSWQAHKSNLSNLFYLEDQNALLSVCNNGSMRKWDYNTYELLDEYYSLPAMPDKKYRKGWAHIDTKGKLRGSIHYKKYFEL